MTESFRARYRNGVIEPLENVELPENTDLIITITEARPANAADALERSAGSWKGTTPSARTLIRRIYAARRSGTRRRPRV